MTNLDILCQNRIEFWSNATLDEIAVHCLGCDQDQNGVTFYTDDGKDFFSCYGDSKADEVYLAAIAAEKEYLMREASDED